MVVRLHARPSRIALSGILVLGVALASWAALRPWVVQRAVSEAPVAQAVRRALAIDSSNDRLHAILGAIYHYDLFLRNYPVALTSYRTALRLNPLDRTSWLHLGKLYATLGHERQSGQAFALAARFGQSDSALLWEIATAQIDAGRVAEAIATLTRFLAVSPPQDAVKGYALARRLAPPDEVLVTMIASDIDHYTHYANYLLDRNLSDQALAVWNRLPDMAARTGEPVNPTFQLRIVDLLLATGQLDQAYRLWTTLMAQTTPDAAPTASNLVSNGNFEHNKTVGRGFDWRIGNAPGVVWAFDPDTAYAGRRSLRLSFVKSRADFSHVSQIIPVQPHSLYALQAHIRTDLSVQEQDARTGLLAKPPGVTVEVLDAAGGVLASTDAVGGTRDWTPVAVRFRTSGTVRIVTLRVHSEPPPPFLPAHSGLAWIDHISLAKVE